MLYQTDFDGYIKHDGCLFFSIAEWCRLLTNRTIVHAEVPKLIDELHYEIRASYNQSIPAVGAEDDPKAEGIFVYDHEAVFNHLLKYLRSKIRVRYTGRIYMPWEEARGKTSFGRHGGDLVILQILTKLGNGHFRNLDYDPWEPGTQMQDLKSLRFYMLL